MFEPVPGHVRFPETEQQILSFWKERADLREDRSSSVRMRRGSSSTKGRRRPTGCRTRATA